MICYVSRFPLLGDVFSQVRNYSGYALRSERLRSVESIADRFTWHEARYGSPDKAVAWKHFAQLAAARCPQEETSTDSHVSILDPRASFRFEPRQQTIKRACRGFIQRSCGCT